MSKKIRYMLFGNDIDDSIRVYVEPKENIGFIQHFTVVDGYVYNDLNIKIKPAKYNNVTYEDMIEEAKNDINHNIASYIMLGYMEYEKERPLLDNFELQYSYIEYIINSDGVHKVNINDYCIHDLPIEQIKRDIRISSILIDN